ncbi:hypothetical protein ACHQM5_016080 [Ranunculus cassubicifolius]
MYQGYLILDDYKVPAEFKEPGSHEILAISADEREFPFSIYLRPPQREPIKMGCRAYKPYKRGKRFFQEG